MLFLANEEFEGKFCKLKVFINDKLNKTEPQLIFVFRGLLIFVLLSLIIFVIKTIIFQ